MKLGNLYHAQEWYTKCGYIHIDVPWVVDLETNLITAPAGAVPTNSDIGYLVGSAEQSFLQLVKDKQLKGKYQATTPCFRNEPEDDLHKKYFMKLELFDNVNVTEETMDQMMYDAVAFFVRRGIIVKMEYTADGCDLVDFYNGIELGSYGIRHHPLVGSWVYGTGCAEPRLSYVQQVHKTRKK